LAHVLHLDASPRGDRSRSRQASAEFLAAWREANPQDTVTYRDLGHAPVPPVDEDWIAAVYSAPSDHSPAQRDAIAVSDELVEELLVADVYVFGVPMYNFNVPAPFKAYIDQVVRPGRTVLFAADAPPKGALVGKRLIVLTARGLAGYGPGEAAEAVNFQDPYVRAIFGFIGVTDVTFIHSDNTMAGEPDAASAAATHAAIRDAVTRAG